MNPNLLAALITQVGIPELLNWLTELHAQDRLVTEAEALAKLDMDVEPANEIGRAFLEGHK